MSDKKYCRLCKKKETRNQCGYGPRLFDKYSVDDATEKETAEAASEAGITESDIKNFSKVIVEKSKSGDSSLHDWFNKSKSSDGKKGWVQLGGKYAGKPCAKQPGQTTKPKCGSSKMKRNLDKDEEQAAFRRKQKEDPNPNRKGKAINVKTEETLHEGDYWHPDPEKDRKLGGPGANQRAREDRASSSSAKKKDDSKKLRPGESYMEYSKRQKGGSASIKPKKKSLLGKLGLRKEEVVIVSEEGKKDACYHKVKRTAKVWPSAYASGRLVQCRKKGAANWGNKTKKEELELTDAYGNTFATVTNLIEPEPIQVVTSAVEYDTYELEEATRVNAVTGNLIHVILTWKGKTYGMKMFFPQVKMPKRSEVQAELEKVYPECRVMYFRIVEKQPGETFLHVSEGAAWTKKSGKNSEGGLNEKGRKSYERENPGSDLKAPSKKVGNPRRASFCARMKGMKKKLTSSKTANDPDSRINKSLRAWNC